MPPRKKARHKIADLDPWRLYYETGPGPFLIPPYVERLREMFLDFQNMFSRDREAELSEHKDDLLDTFSDEHYVRTYDDCEEFRYEWPAPNVWPIPDEDAVPPDSAYAKIKSKSLSSAASVEFSTEQFERAENLARKACGYHKDAEYKWHWFLRDHIFETAFTASASVTSSAHLGIREFAMFQDCTFYQAADLPLFNGKQMQECSDSKEPKAVHTKPKPDLCISFQVHDTRDLGPDSSTAYFEDGIGRYFSLDVLAHLRRGPYGLLSSVLTNLNTARAKREIDSHHLTCFPWTIVECKKRNVPTEECYCQAIKGAYAASMFRARLMEPYLGRDEDVPPTIVFTSIGPRVTVWLAFFCDPPGISGAYKMVPIWDLCLYLTWGIASLQRIVSNMLKWASTELRLKLCNCIKRWVDDCPENDSPPTPLPRRPVTPMHRNTDDPNQYRRRSAQTLLTPTGDSPLHRRARSTGNISRQKAQVTSVVSSNGQSPMFRPFGAVESGLGHMEKSMSTQKSRSRPTVSKFSGGRKDSEEERTYSIDSQDSTSRTDRRSSLPGCEPTVQSKRDSVSKVNNRGRRYVESCSSEWQDIDTPSKALELKFSGLSLYPNLEEDSD